MHCYQVTGKQSYLIDIYFISEERDKFLAAVSRYGVYSIDLVLGSIDLK